ncbi:hypothetical protein B0H19DRAFT_1082481 [Mycena capillaripes]|nr:hypothetical protein B0H19DRAFT_1082481 [Mycena capillaripes]
MYLVTQGRRVGVWYNWTIVKAVVDGYPSGAQRGHQTMKSCVAEWQQHCVLGVHPHPMDPALLTTGNGTPRGMTPPAAISRSPSPGLREELGQAELVATTWVDVPEVTRFFAIWGGRIAYSDRNYYETRVKEHVEAELVALRDRAKREGKPPQQKIDVVSKVTTRIWEGETAGLKKECEIVVEREYQEALKAWNALLADSPTRTAEEIAATLQNASFYLQPFVDAIQERFGMCASVLLCGPIGTREGRIGMQSGATKGLAPVNWPNYDWQSFSELEKSMIAFAKECFSDAECRARAITTPDAGSTNISRSSGAGAAGGAAGGGAAGGAAQSPGAPATTTMSAGAAGGATGGGAAGGAAQSPGAPATTTMQQQNPESTTLESRDVQMGLAFTDERPNDNAPGAGADGDGRGEVDDVEPTMCDQYWQRDDREGWTEELQHAHAAFERGRGWGKEWAICVSRFFDFEAAWGFAEGTWQMGAKNRPRQVGEWLARMRKWSLPPALGDDLGTRKVEESFAADWWIWWCSLQPPERFLLNDEMSRPDDADWSQMAAMYGKNGLLQVMATLGEKILTATNRTVPEDESQDEGTVRDVETETGGKQKKRAAAGSAGGRKTQPHAKIAKNADAPERKKRGREKEGGEAEGLRRGKRRRVEKEYVIKAVEILQVRGHVKALLSFDMATVAWDRIKLEKKKTEECARNVHVETTGIKKVSKGTSKWECSESAIGNDQRHQKRAKKKPKTGEIRGF